MATWIALFRGINVGGNHPLPMAELRAELADLGFEDVRSYIQSGNVVFSARGKAQALASRAPALIEVVVDGEIAPPLGDRARAIAGFEG